jgi:hypothetical protein
MTRQVYFARCIAANGADMGAIKIGCSYQPLDRVGAVSALQPYECKLLATCAGTMLEEAIAHLWLREHRIAGEFFHDTPEVMAFVDEVIRTGAFPVRFRIGASEYLPSMAEATAFMARHGLVVDEMQALTGATSTTYRDQIKLGKRPNRRFIAAMMVAALRRGHRINWPQDVRPLDDAAREAVEQAGEAA